VKPASGCLDAPIPRRFADDARRHVRDAMQCVQCAASQCPAHNLRKLRPAPIPLKVEPHQWRASLSARTPRRSRNSEELLRSRADPATSTARGSKPCSIPHGTLRPVQRRVVGLPAGVAVVARRRHVHARRARHPLAAILRQVGCTATCEACVGLSETRPTHVLGRAIVASVPVRRRCGAHASGAVHRATAAAHRAHPYYQQNGRTRHATHGSRVGQA
jgi:hypothetical protein